MTFGNGVTTRYTYDPSTRRLSDLTAGKNSAQLFQNLHYGFDPVGNITSLVNAPASGMNFTGPLTARYAYDDLYRLTSAGGTFQQDAATTRAYTLNMGYDSIHNITSKIQSATTTVSGVPSPDTATSYPFFSYQYGPKKPHAVNLILRSDIIQGTQAFTYDANGNRTQNFEGDNQTLMRTLDWDEENRLLRVCQPAQATDCQPDSILNSNRSEYLYDAGGERASKNVYSPDVINGSGLKDEETLYPNQFFTARTTTDSTGVGNRHKTDFPENLLLEKQQHRDR